MQNVFIWKLPRHIIVLVSLGIQRDIFVLGECSVKLSETNAWLVTINSTVPLSVYFLVIRKMFMEEVEVEQGLGHP